MGRAPRGTRPVQVGEGGAVARETVDRLLDRAGTTYADRGRYPSGRHPGAAVPPAGDVRAALDADLRRHRGGCDGRAGAQRDGHAGTDASGELAGPRGRAGPRPLQALRREHRHRARRRRRADAHRVPRRPAPTARPRRPRSRPIRELLTAFPRLGPVGAEIFCREAQAVWPELRPTLDRKAIDGAKAVGLPADADELAGARAAPGRWRRSRPRWSEWRWTRSLAEEVRAG